MYSGSYPNPYAGTAIDPNAPKPDPMTQPLPIVTPDTWLAREDRVRWVLENFTKGESAKLCRLLKDKYAHYDLRAIERQERESLEPKPAKRDARWP
jgi:hypothetical protein